MKIDYLTSFQWFVDAVGMDYHQIYDFYQAAVGKTESLIFFKVEPKRCGGCSIIDKGSGHELLLTSDSRDYLPKWIKKTLMDDMDPESYYGLQCNLNRGN